jgi:hypothetical protein
MAPKEPRDKEQTGRISERGLFLVSDRTPQREWESFERWELKRPRERLGPIRSSTTRAKKRPKAKK